MVEKQDASVYAENMEILEKTTKSEVIETFMSHAKVSDIQKIIESRETLYHICRIIKIMNIEEDKKYRDFFIDLKSILESIRTFNQVKKKIKKRK